MKTVIFAGGLGSRISEESHLKPKPMIEIGEKPIIWHIMKIYAHYGFNEFIICLGYKGNSIKEYFMNYFIYSSDVTVDLGSNEIDIHRSRSENFKITLVDTGLETKTAGRLQKIKKYITEDNFMLTYGDGVSDIDLKKLVEFHFNHGKIATVTAVRPNAKFGVLNSDEFGLVKGFVEKPKISASRINGGFFVLRKEIFGLLDGDMEGIMWEEEPMRSLVDDDQLMAHNHDGFWKSMDILRDKVELEYLWKTTAPWKVWK